MGMNRIINFCLLVSLFLFSCGGDTDSNGKKLSTATAGEATIAVDESLQPVISSSVDSFHDNYPGAKVSPLFLPETDAIKMLMNDSVQVAVLGRDLTDAEKDYFKKIKFPVRSTKIAYDAVALIVNKGNKDTVLELEKLKDILTGNIRYWNQLDPTMPKEEIQVVFDHSGSSTVSYLKNYFHLPEKLPTHFYAVKSNPEVISYVEKNKTALGVIGLNWISDHDDSMAVGFLSKIKVVGISPPQNAKGVDMAFYQPYQYYIAMRWYPLVREVYAVNREPRTGLGTGFVSYLAGNKGQTVINLSGLLPATRQVRVIEFTK
jgi:phosphate transport system substrate-binding protein